MKTALIIFLALSNAVLASFLLVRPSSSSGKVTNVAPAVAAQHAGSEATPLESGTRLDEATKEIARLNTLVDDMRGEIAILHAGRSTGPGARLNNALPVPRAVLNELLGNPDTVKLAMDWIKADLRPRYASLVALQTQLSDAQREQLFDLLAERYATRMDLAAAGADNLTTDLKKQLDAEHKGKLLALVGAAGADLFEKSEVKPVTWERMQRLDQRLRYEASPLDQQQYGALWPVLSNAVFYYKQPANESEARALLAQRASGMQTALEQARQLLNPAQFTTLSRLLDDDNTTFNVQMQARVKAIQARSQHNANGSPAAPVTPP